MKVEQVSFRTYHSEVELLCPHGIGHDMGVHGCDGCCSDKSFKKAWKEGVSDE